MLCCCCCCCLLGVQTLRLSAACLIHNCPNRLASCQIHRPLLVLHVCYPPRDAILFQKNAMSTSQVSTPIWAVVNGLRDQASAGERRAGRGWFAAAGIRDVAPTRSRVDGRAPGYGRPVMPVADSGSPLNRPPDRLLCRLRRARRSGQALVLVGAHYSVAQTTYFWYAVRGRPAPSVKNEGGGGDRALWLT